MTMIMWTAMAVGAVVTVVTVCLLASDRVPAKWVERGGREPARQKMKMMSAAAVLLTLFPVPYLREWEYQVPITMMMVLMSLGVSVWGLVWELRYPKRRQAPLPGPVHAPRLHGEAPPGRTPNL